MTYLTTGFLEDDKVILAWFQWMTSYPSNFYTVYLFLYIKSILI